VNPVRSISAKWQNGHVEFSPRLAHCSPQMSLRHRHTGRALHASSLFIAIAFAG
jgi:hypothetical protein